MSAPEISIPVEVVDAAIKGWFSTLPESWDQQEHFRIRMRAAFAAAGYTAAPAAGDARDARDAERLRRIAWLIGSIFVHGDFKAETVNERELEKLLRENGTFWDSLAQFDAAIGAQQGKGGEHA
ncbi:hypothetical protein [Achromobacter anxifer]|uniref:hypothetical protein n=1 Tax=Achromobacter anxifer TaxID=1287737 RepID=UPI0021589E7D|nr:hypothetical protein [Achromobacter anxifer]